MSAPSDAMPAAASATPAGPATLVKTRPLYWSLRRELWENRSLYIAPLSVAGVILLALLVSTVNVHVKVTGDLHGPDALSGLAIALAFVSMAIILTSLLVGVFYCLGALHNERRDRSILFWKSLPVSDLTTVASKVLIPLAVLPAITFAIVLAMQLIMLLIAYLAYQLTGTGVANLAALPLGQIWLILVYGLITQTLWYAPVWGWLLLVSAWARRAPFLWAVLPPLALCIVERLAVHTTYLASLLQDRLAHGSEVAFRMADGGDGTRLSLSNLPQPDLMHFVSSPSVWIGLLVAAACVAGAVRLRRVRETV
jgi:ABC-2 type transport system permease protein